MKYLLDTVQSSIVNVGEKQYSIQQVMEHVNNIYKSIIDTNLKNKTAIKIIPSIDLDEQLSADDLSTAENERELEAMIREHKGDLKAS